jgi:hypothetical protein
MLVGKALNLIKAGNDAQFARRAAALINGLDFTLSSAAHHQLRKEFRPLLAPSSTLSDS